MQYGNIAGVKKPVSRLIQGNTMISEQDLDYAFQLLDDVFELGCNAFDTAHIYGNGSCERALGKWMKARRNRDKVVVITKGAHHNADRRRVTPYDITSDLHDSLARLQTDYIDLYLLHRDDPSVPVGPIVEVLNEHLRAGKILAFGGSNWTHDRVRKANAYAKKHGLVPFSASSPNFSLAEMVEEPWSECVSIGGPKNREAQEWYRRNKMPVLAWSSLAGGFLSGQFTPEQIAALPKDCPDIYCRCYRSKANLKRLERAFTLAKKKGTGVPQIALAWLLHQPLLVFPLVACRNRAEFAANCEAFDISLTPEEVAWLDEGKSKQPPK